MKMALFFLISVLLHSMIVFLPFNDNDSHEEKGRAIPVTLVLKGIDTGRTLSTKVKESRPQEPAPSTMTQPETTIKKLATKKPVKKPIMRKLAEVRSPEPRVSLEEKRDVRRRGVQRENTKTVQVTAEVTTGKDKEAKNPVEREETSTQLEIEDWFVRELLEEDSNPEPSIEVASLSLASKPKDTAATASSPVRELNDPVGDVNTQESGREKSVFARANYARIVKPEYPGQARKMGWEGTTLLKVLVDQQGKSKIVKISRSSGFETLDKAAVEAVKHWQFHPARSGTGPVESWVKIPIVFNLKEDKN